MLSSGDLKRLVVPVVCLAAATGILACGEGDEPERAQSAGVGELRLDSAAPLAMCSDWRAGDEAERKATIEDIRAQINLQDTPTRTPELSDEDAYEVFENACAEEFSAGFRLYKIYAAAAGYQSLQDPGDG